MSVQRICVAPFSEFFNMGYQVIDRRQGQPGQVGVVHGLQMGTWSTHRGKPFCIPERINSAQARLMFNKSVTETPKLLHDEAARFWAATLATAFPCPLAAGIAGQERAGVSRGTRHFSRRFFSAFGTRMVMVAVRGLRSPRFQIVPQYHIMDRTASGP
jgi:Rap1a immunity proteins